ncbi:HigA family addiction module antitoxin [Candidatus Thiodubiliella endoseptemdiera]|uniref:HigA family addiction module antitoxin n=1 Tax=Candidatus Thiodubiliella endoseptemdiera TaxID=2738886 RepID=UPI0034DEBAAD
MISIPTNREPTHPGEILLEEFLKPMHLSQVKLANALQVSYQRVNELVNKKRGVTPSSALRLAKVFNISEDFWLNLQLCFDLYHAKKKENTILESIHLTGFGYRPNLENTDNLVFENKEDYKP